MKRIAWLAVSSLLAVSAHAQFTWVGGGGDSNWTTGDNWQGGVAPSANASLIFTGANTTNNNDYAADTQFNGITFAAGASAFTLSGNAINLAGDIATNSSTANTTQTVAMNLALLQNATLSAWSNSTIFGNMIFSGVLSGTGFGIVKSGIGVVTLGNANTYTGPTVIRQSGLTINATGNLSADSALVLGGTATARGAATLTLNRTGGQTLTVNGTTFTPGRSSLVVTRSSGSGNTTLALGALTRQAHSTAYFSTNNGQITTTTDNTNGILGGWAYVGQNWAANNGSGTIVAYSAYTEPAGLNPTVSSDASTNIRITNVNDFTISGNLTYNSNIITNVSDVSGLAVGDPLTAWATNATTVGTGELKIPAGAVITAIDSSDPGNLKVTISGNVERGTGGTQTATATVDVITITAAKPMTMAASGTTDVNSVMIIDMANRVVNIGDGNTLRLGATGGIWRSTASVAHSDRNSLMFTGGNLTAGGADNTAGEIVFRPDGSTTTDSSGTRSRPSPGIIVGSSIVNNGSGVVRVTKDGEQTVRFTAANSYTGGTYVLRGRLQLTGSGSLGTGDVYLMTDPTNYSGGTVDVGGNITLANNFFVSGSGYQGNLTSLGAGALVLQANSAVSGTVTLQGDTYIGGGGNNNVSANATISGKITGTGNLTAGGSGVFLILSNATNDWAGDLRFINGGSSGSTSSTLRIEAEGALGNGTANLTMHSVHANPSVTVDLRGNSESINALNSTGGQATAKYVLQSSTGSAILTLGNGNADGTYYGTVQNGGGTLGLLKKGTGTQVLSGTNTYTGSTTVENGTLSVSGSLTGTSGVSITGGIFAYSNAAALTRNVTIDGGTFRYTSAGDYAGTPTFTAGRLEGTNWNGNLSGLMIDTGKTVAPGTSPGTATTGNQTWGGGGSFELEINNATGTAGTDWDLLNVTDTLDISGLSSSSKFTIKLVSLDALNAPGLALNFNKANNDPNDPSGYNWTFATFVTLAGTFSSDRFAVDTTGFQNDFSGGSFEVRQSGNSLVLSYIPEPGTAGLVLGGLALMALRRRRMRG